jgi:hypothetical protein
LKVIGNLECRIKFYSKKNRGTSSIQLNILILQLTVYLASLYSVAGEVLKDREIGTNPLADRMASVVMLFAGGN